MMPVSNDTLLRLVRRRGSPAFAPPRAIGIDDWAWKRNARYGTLICDLERRCTISLPPDREPATAQAWLAAQPQVEVVTRDRGGAYALAATRALPGAMQVADRWHLMENASQAFLTATRSCMRQIRAELGAVTVDPDLLTAAEKLQYEGYMRREDVNAAVMELAKAGVTIRRSYAVPATAAAWSGASCAASVATCSCPATARLNATCHGWMLVGRRANRPPLRSGAN